MSRVERVLAAEEYAALLHAAATQTEAIARLTSQIVNNVLRTELVRFDATGVKVLEFATAIGSVNVANHGAAAVTVASGTPTGGSAPSGGIGVASIRAGIAGTVNLTGTVVTLWGSAGDTATVQVFTRAQPPSWGPA